MKTLKEALQPFRIPPHAGEVETLASLNAGDVNKNLKIVIAHSDRVVWIWIGLLIVLFLVDLSLLWKYVGQPKMLEAIFGASGVGFAYVIKSISGVWKQKFTTETLLAILPTLDQDNLRKVVDKLLSSLD